MNDYKFIQNTLDMQGFSYNNISLYNTLLTDKSHTYTKLKTPYYYGNINHIFTIPSFNVSKVDTTIIVIDFCTITIQDAPIKFMTINPLPGFESSVLPKLLYQSLKKHYKVNYSYNIRTFIKNKI